MNELLSFQDVLSARQRAEFAGREYELEVFRANLARDPSDPNRHFIINVSGQGGVGKTSLIRHYQQIALHYEVATGFTNELENDIPDVMARLANDMRSRRWQFKKFDEKYDFYRQALRGLESDPDMPKGAAAFAGRMLAKTGISVIKATVPGTALILDFIGDDSLAEQVGAWAEFVQRKISDKNDLRLLLNPVGVLTQVFLDDLAKVGKKQRTVLFLDTYEYTAGVLDLWLRSILAGEYGPLTLNTLLVIAGREGLNRNLWVPFETLIKRIQLEVFSDEEARTYLARKKVTNQEIAASIIEASGGLPLLLATLSSQSPGVSPESIDPTATAVSRFLKWIPDIAQREFVLDISLARQINKDLVTVVLGKDSAGKAFEWIIHMPFVRYQASHWVFHPVVRNQLVRMRLRESPTAWRNTHLTLAAFYSDREKLAVFGDTDTYAVERLYHELCASPNDAIGRVLSEFVRRLVSNPAVAGMLAQVIDDASQATGYGALLEWARCLKDGISGYERNELIHPIRMLNQLIEQGQLTDDAVAVAYAWRGEAEHWLGNYLQAIRDLSEALEREPRNDWAYVLRGITNRNLCAYDEANQDLANAVALNPRGLYGLTEIAKLHFQVFGDFATARMELDAALSIDPQYGWAHLVRGDLRRLMGDFAGSIADFSRAILAEMRYQHYYWALIRRASSYRRLGLTAEAMSDLMLALERYPRDDWVHYEISLTHSLEQRYVDANAELDIAITTCNDMLARDPDNYFQRMRMVTYEIVRFNNIPYDLMADQLPIHHCFELYHELEEIVYVFPSNEAARNLMSMLRVHLPE